MAGDAPRLGVLYGGTFDPVHDGHVGVARHARDALDADVWLMPAADPPHKAATHADAAQRVRMLRLALAGEPRLGVDLRELRRDGPSYTVDTLRELRAEVGRSAPWAILVGADGFRALDRWSRWRELFALAHVVVAGRPGHPLEAGLPEAVAEELAARRAEAPGELRSAAAGRVLLLHQPLSPHSSSELRRRIAAGRAWRDWVAPTVADYIERQGLYR